VRDILRSSRFVVWADKFTRVYLVHLFFSLHARGITAMGFEFVTDANGNATEVMIRTADSQLTAVRKAEPAR
jgi:hypothetical protein